MTDLISNNIRNWYSVSDHYWIYPQSTLTNNERPGLHWLSLKTTVLTILHDADISFVFGVLIIKKNIIIVTRTPATDVLWPSETLHHSI